MEIGAAISAISSAIGLAKHLNELDKQLDEATLRMTIANLTSDLAQAKLAMIDVNESLMAKDAEIKDLKQKLVKKSELVEHNYLKYDADKNGSAIGLPYCSRCLEVDGIFVKAPEKPEGRRYIHACPQCKTEFRGRVIKEGGDT